MNYSFEPGKRKGRNKYVGSWKETGWRTIPLEFSADSLVIVLSWGVHADFADFSHQDIANWCDQFYWAYLSGKWRQEQNEASIKAVAEIANDVSAQWDMFLVNSFTLKERQALQFSTVNLPIEWFQKWLSEAELLVK